MPRVILEPIDARAERIIKEHGSEFEVLTVTQDQIVVRSADGEWLGAFDRREARWPENILTGE